MKITYTLSDEEKTLLENEFKNIKSNPYFEHEIFKSEIQGLISSNKIPNGLIEICNNINKERILQGIHVHVLSNCVIDRNLPDLNLDDPVNDKYLSKKTFYAECFMELIAQLQNTPIFAYESRNNGDYYTDLVAFNKYKGKKTGFTDGDLVYHSDRTYHPVRADYVSLLGLKVAEKELIYANYIDVKELKKYLDEETISLLSQEIFITEVDDRSKEMNLAWENSICHAIFINENEIRYQDTFTHPQDPNNINAIKALIKLKDAMSKSKKIRHQIKEGELLIFGNQTGIHNREWIDVNNLEDGRKRWLLKTYSFSDISKITKYSKWTRNNNLLIIIDKE